ncbi:MAG: Gfo/Idh/MocA family oxidoreductase [Isosphaeraceae bacterium]|nr:Gfo/Idh/MocA family oxidoreductase [Isosphaeraceae bacterium]
MKVLMIGLGGIGQRHLRNLHSLLGDDLVVSAYRVRRLAQVVTDRLTIEPGSDIEKKYNVRVFDDLDCALAQRPDVALVCNPSSLHVPVALRAARAGCHLFLEKPLSHELDSVGELIEEVNSRGLVGLVGYQLRFHPCLTRLHDVLRGGMVGRVVAVRMEVGEYLPGWHTYEDYRHMYASRPELGGGVILSQIHEMDAIYWLFGLPSRVYSIGGHLSRLEIDVEDTASTLMSCQSDGQTFPVHLHQDYVQRPPSRTYQVIGDSGKVVVDLREPSITRYEADGEIAEHTTFDRFERNQLFLDEMTHLLACLRGEQIPAVSLHDGVQSLRMALAAKRSIETGRVIELEDDL